MLNVVSFIGYMIFSVENTSLVGNSIEYLFDHDGLENDDKYVKGREYISSLSNEFPFVSVNAFNMVSIFNGHNSVACNNNLGNTENGIVNNKDLSLLSMNSQLTLKKENT